MMDDPEDKKPDDWAEEKRIVDDEARKPDDWDDEEDIDTVGLLQKSLYGTRDTAANFQKEVWKFMTSQGVTVGRYNASTFYHGKMKIKTMVHGDDFVSVGRASALQRFKTKL